MTELQAQGQASGAEEAGKDEASLLADGKDPSGVEMVDAPLIRAFNLLREYSAFFALSVCINFAFRDAISQLSIRDTELSGRSLFSAHRQGYEFSCVGSTAPFAWMERLPTLRNQSRSSSHEHSILDVCNGSPACVQFVHALLGAQPLIIHHGHQMRRNLISFPRMPVLSPSLLKLTLTMTQSDRDHLEHVIPK